MQLFGAYRFSAKTCRPYYRQAQLIGLVPIFFALLLALSMRRTPGPGLWSAFGVALGLEIVLAAMYRLHLTEAPKSQRAHELIAQSDQWFPSFLFIIRHLFEILIFLMLWLCLTDLGFPGSLLMHGEFIVLLVLWPIKGLTREIVRTSNLAKHHITDEFFHYLMITTATFLVATSITHFVIPPGKTITSDITPHVVIVWVPAILIVISCIMLFADHRRRYGATTPAPAKEETPF